MMTGQNVGFVGTLAGYELLVVPGGDSFGTICSAIDNASEVLCGTSDAEGNSYCFFGSPAK